MLNIKEQLIRDYAHDYRDMQMDEIELAVLLARFSTEIIEKLIEEIPDHAEGFGQYCDTGEDMGWRCRSECTEEAIKRLRAKWLGNSDVIAGVDFGPSLNALEELGKETNE